MARQTSLKSCFEVQASSSSSTISTSEASNDAPIEESKSNSDSGDSDITSKSSPLHCPVKRKKKVEKELEDKIHDVAREKLT